MRKTFILALMMATVFILGLSGCGRLAHKGYRPNAGFGIGFSDTQLGENIFRVTYEGDEYISGERARDFCLLRASDLSIANGFRYFVVQDSEKDSKISATTTPNAYDFTTLPTKPARPIGFQGQPQSTTTHLKSSPIISYTILCFQEEPEGGRVVYDAWFLTGSIRQKYGIPD